MSTNEIPLSAKNERFHITLGGTDYTFILRWNFRASLWILDIGDANGFPLLNGIPLVVGVNLLAGHKAFNIGGIGGNLFIRTTGPDQNPNFQDLGNNTRLYFGYPTSLPLDVTALEGAGEGAGGGEPPEDLRCPGAVIVGHSMVGWDFPSMQDSSKFVLSFWVMVSSLLQHSTTTTPSMNGDMFNGNTAYIIRSPQFSMFIAQSTARPGSPGYPISVTTGFPTIVTTAGTHGVQAGSVLASPALTGTYKVLSVTPNTFAVGGTSLSLGGIQSYQVFNSFQIELVSASGDEYYIWSTSTHIPPDEWVNVLISGDMNQPAGQKILKVYYGETQIQPNGVLDTTGPFDVYFSEAPSDKSDAWGIGTTNFPTSGQMECYMGEFVFAPGHYLDFDDPLNRAFFHDADNHPMPLGRHGEAPFGEAPILYLHQPPDGLGVLPVKGVDPCGIPYSYLGFTQAYLYSEGLTGSPPPPVSPQLTFSMWIDSFTNGDILTYVGMSSYVNINVDNGICTVIIDDDIGYGPISVIVEYPEDNSYLNYRLPTGDETDVEEWLYYEPGVNVPSSEWVHHYAVDVESYDDGTYYTSDETFYAPLGWPQSGRPAYETIVGDQPVDPAGNPPWGSSPYLRYQGTAADTQAEYDNLLDSEKPIYNLFTNFTGPDDPGGVVYRYGMRMIFSSFQASAIGVVDNEIYSGRNGLMQVNVYDEIYVKCSLVNMSKTPYVEIYQANYNILPGHNPAPAVKATAYRGGVYSVDPATKRLINTGGIEQWTGTIPLATYPPDIGNDDVFIGQFFTSGIFAAARMAEAPSTPPKPIARVEDTTGFKFSFPYTAGLGTNIRVAIDIDHSIGHKIVKAYAGAASAPITVILDTKDNFAIDWQQSVDLKLLNNYGYVGQLWVGPGQYFDPQSEFVDSAGDPYYLGTSGQLVSGSSPHIYLNIEEGDEANDFAINRGTGGNFDILDRNLNLAGLANLSLASGTPFLVNKSGHSSLRTIEGNIGLEPAGRDLCTPFPRSPVFILFDFSCHLYITKNFGSDWAEYNSPAGTMSHSWRDMAMAINDDDYVTMCMLDQSYLSGGVSGAVAVRIAEEFTSAVMHSVPTGRFGVALATDGTVFVPDDGGPCHISRDYGVTWASVYPDMVPRNPAVPAWFPTDVVANDIKCPTLGAGLPSPLSRFTISFWGCAVSPASIQVEGPLHGNFTRNRMVISFYAQPGTPAGKVNIIFTANVFNADGAGTILGGSGVSYGLEGTVNNYLQSDNVTLWEGQRLVHFLYTVDFVAQTMLLYCNDQPVTTHTTGSWFVSMPFNGTLESPWQLLTMRGNNVWISEQVLNVADPAVRRQFINADYSAVAMASNGQITLPGGTTVVPKVYLQAEPPAAASTFVNNKGTGPTWAVNSGTLSYLVAGSINNYTPNCLRATTTYNSKWTGAAFSENRGAIYVQKITGRMWKSVDDAYSFTELASSFVNNQETKIRCSKDGAVVIASDLGWRQFVDISIDGGASWRRTDFWDYVGDTERSFYYFDFGMSIDGSIILVVGQTWRYGSYAWTSVDYGATWQRTGPLPASDQAYHFGPSQCAISPDGQVMFAGYESEDETGWVVVSVDKGKTWIKRVFPLDNSISNSGSWVSAWIVPQ